jgi:cytosolic carboxypeptidase protein 6
MSDIIIKNILKIQFILVTVILFALLVVAACTKKDNGIKGLAYDPPGSTITTDKEIAVQSKKTYHFNNTGLYVSNEFEGGRLNDFYQLNDSSYTAVIEPENAPINNSAWYAFKLWADEEQNIILNLNYIDGTHRYAPKLSYDRIEWTAFDTTLIETDTSRTLASLKLSIGTDTLWFSAQELITSSDYERWENKLAELPYVSKKVIGKSSQDRVINELLISENASNNYIVIISRQHPPEVTGFFALKTFVETVTGETDIAAEFRKKFNTLVIPLVNPDGVDNGHWRHNFHGVDLNRDWVNFNQLEPRAVRNEISSIVDEGGKINFFIDFHSTQKDVFYTQSLKSTIPENFSEEEKVTAENNFALIGEWLRNLQRRLPDYYVNITDTLSKTTSPTSARWIQREFNAPALTYETGDETDRELIKKVAANAAEELMKLLNDRRHN